MLTRRKFVAAAMAAAGAAVAAPRLLAAPAQMSAADAYAKASAGEILLLDIRTPAEWKRTGIGEPAQPLNMLDSAFLQKLAALTGGDKTRPIVLICAVGGRSTAVQKHLTAAGYGAVYSVPEGMLGSRAGPGWIRSGLPVKAYAP